MSKRSESFNRLRTYLRNNRINYQNTCLGISFHNIHVTKSKQKEYFKLSSGSPLWLIMQVPWSEPDTIVKKVLAFSNMCKLLAPGVYNGCSPIGLS